MLFAGLPLLAQFSDLATTTDGSDLYFSSKLRLRGSNQSDAPKIFRHGVKFDLFREVIRDNSSPLAPSNYYILIEPQVSADGKIVVYTSTQECYKVQNSHCELSYQVKTDGANVPANVFGPGHARVSPDGRYIAACCLFNVLFNTTEVFDRATGQSVRAVPLVSDGLQAFADGGILLASGLNSNSVAIYHANDSWVAGTPVALSAQVLQARLSRNGSTILYTGVNFDKHGSPTVYELIAHDLASGKETVLESFGPSSQFNGIQPGRSFTPWISDDGRRALYLAPATPGGPLQLFVRKTSGGDRRLIGDLSEGFNAITLSGDGEVAYAATPSGRLLHIDVDSGATSQISGPVPIITDLQPCIYTISCSVGSGAVAPGSIAWLMGSGFPEHDTPHAVRVNGISAPIFENSQGYLRIQIPWETPVNQRIAFVVDNASPQPFESVKTENSAAIAPNWLLASYDNGSPAFGFALLLHQDFKSAVNESDPARDGEILHMYMTGLGPVSPAVGTGQPSPVKELSRLTNAMTCSTNPQSVNYEAVPVVFAGLAPGLSGLYQVDMKAPPGFSKNGTLVCTITDSSGKTHIAQASVQ